MLLVFVVMFAGNVQRQNTRGITFKNRNNGLQICAVRWYQPDTPFLDKCQTDWKGAAQYFTFGFLSQNHPHIDFANVHRVMVLDAWLQSGTLWCNVGTAAVACRLRAFVDA